MVFCVLFAAICSVLFVAGEGTRGPIAEVMLHLIVAISLSVKLSTLTKVAFFSIASVSLVGLSFMSNKMYSLLAGGGSMLEGMLLIWQRAILGNTLNDIVTIDLVREGFLTYRLGAIQFGQFMNSIPGVQYSKPFSYYLGVALGASGKTTYASTTFLGVAYADFGFVGVIFLYILMGLIVAWAQGVLFKTKKTIPNIAFTSLVFYRLGWMYRTGIVGAIAPLVIGTLVHLGINAALQPRLEVGACNKS